MRAFALLPLLPLWIACGDPLLTGTDHGTPYWTVIGNPSGDTGGMLIEAPMAAIVWFGPSSETVHRSLKLEPLQWFFSPAFSISPFYFDVWELPPEPIMDSLCGTRVALGVVVLLDRKHHLWPETHVYANLSTRVDGSFRVSPEEVFGIGEAQVILYADAPLRDCAPFPDLDRGFHVLRAVDCWSKPVDERTVDISLFPPTDRLVLPPHVFPFRNDGEGRDCKGTV